jgi:hypothetical protein
MFLPWDKKAKELIVSENGGWEVITSKKQHAPFKVKNHLATS